MADDNVRAISGAEKEAKSVLIQAELAGHPMWVKPVNKWKASAIHALREGDLQTWAEKTLDPDDYDIWEDVDPDMDEISAFFETINGSAGVDTGNSRSSRRSSKSTRTR